MVTGVTKTKNGWWWWWCGRVLSLFLDTTLVIFFFNPLKGSFIPPFTQEICTEHSPWAGRYSEPWG